MRKRAATTFLYPWAEWFSAVFGGAGDANAFAMSIAFGFIRYAYESGFAWYYSGNKYRLLLKQGDAFSIDAGFYNLQFHVSYLRKARFGSVAKLSRE